MTELYLYQTIHLCAGRPRLVAEHVAVLNEASERVFELPYTPNLKQLEARIRTLTAAHNYPDSVSGFVRIELLPDGNVRLVPSGVSLYKGYALRSVTPDAVTIRYELPAGCAPTSAREAAALLARKQAELRNASAAVRCNDEGLLLAADEAPLFAIRGKEVFTSYTEPCVERDLGIRASRAAGLKLAEGPIERAELSGFDELFYVDHRGVTALAHCDGHPYMHLLSERVAVAMEGLFSVRL